MVDERGEGGAVSQRVDAAVFDGCLFMVSRPVKDTTERSYPSGSGSFWGFGPERERRGLLEFPYKRIKLYMGRDGVKDLTSECIMMKIESHIGNNINKSFIGNIMLKDTILKPLNGISQ